MMDTDPNPNDLAIPSTTGKAPKSRIKSAMQAWEICNDLEKQDKKRAKKRSRIFKAYNRFPPTEYSTLKKEGQDWQSNVNYGMMAGVIDNNISTFYDMLTERTAAAEIQTKMGNSREQKEWSDSISEGFDMVLKDWDDYLLNAEQDLLDMALYGKGVEMKEDEEGCFTEHLSADDFLVPDGTKISFNNFDVCCVRKQYSLFDLWKRVMENDGEGRGWNKKAALKAMRVQREKWCETYKDETEWTKAVAQGDVTLAANLKEYVSVFVLFVKQFGGKVGKYIVLRDYAPITSLTRKGRSMVMNKEDELKDVVNKEGFLYQKEEFADDISDVFSVFMDCAGSGMWHNIPSLGEKIFVQCRQYDFTMNAIMDAVKINMSLMLQASSPEASEKIKELVFGPYTIIPSDVPFVQQRFSLPVQEATQTVQFMMLDMFRGIGDYRINERAQSGQAVTATQNRNDQVESAKISGTALKRYNAQHSFWYRKIYESLVSLSNSDPDYKYCEKFKDHMKERGVPKEAWEFKNIKKITSTILNGAGSPSVKLMAAEKTIALTNISPKGEGQANAVKDALAAVNGRSNVERYFVQVRPDKDFGERLAGWENELLSNPFSNPADIQVNPDDDDFTHIPIHLGSMERTIELVNERMEKQALSEYLAESAVYKMLNIGGHVQAHMQKAMKDESKEQLLKQAAQKLNEIQKGADDMARKLQAMKDQKKSEFDPTSDPDIAKKVALSQIEVDTKEKLSNIKIGSKAQTEAQKMELAQEKAANEIAIERAKAANKQVV